jgi:hypothetical protein
MALPAGRMPPPDTTTTTHPPTPTHPPTLTAQDWGLIDGIIRGDNDFTPPPSLVASLREAGFVDDLSGGVLKTGRSFTTL